MAIKGSLKEASLPDVFQLLAMGQKSGCLTVTDRSNFGYVYFDQGRITYASILNRPTRLGELMVKRGVISREDLSGAMEQQAREPDKRLGRILVERGSLTEEQLTRFLQIQIEEAVYHLFTWTEGHFYFEVDQRPDESEELLVSINPENLLLEGARRVDEWSLVEKKIPSLDLIFDLERDPASAEDLTLEEDQKKILPYLDGEHSVREIVEETGMVEFDVGKALFGLIQAGFAHRVGERERRGSGVAREAEIHQAMNLGIAFYQTAMYEEAAREFRKVAGLRPDDTSARFHLGIIALRTGHDGEALRHLRQVAEKGMGGYAAFMNMALALERLERFDDAKLALEQAESREPDDADVALARAILELRSGDVAGAGAALHLYRSRLGDAVPSALYYAYAVVAAAAAGELDGALALGREGRERYPDDPVLAVHLGVVLERRREFDDAEAIFREAVENAPSLPQAHKNLGDVLYRKGEYEEARAHFDKAVKLAPDLGDDVYLKLGNIAYKEMDRERAVEHWERALELDPRNEVVRTNLELMGVSQAS